MGQLDSAPRREGESSRPVIKNLVRSVAHKMGYEIRRIDRIGNDADEYQAPDPLAGPIAAALKTVRPYTMLSEARLTTLFRQVIHCDRMSTEGAFVECGTWKGGAVGMMALANRHAGGPPRHLHLFDAFDDICEPDPEVDGKRILDEVQATLGDVPVAGELKPMKGAYDTFGGAGTIDAARELIETKIGYDPELVHFHKGWFQDTVPVDAKDIGPIAVLRLDGDLYYSIKVCLEHLYDQVVPGGFVVIDDYSYYEGCTRAVDEFIANRKLDAYLHPADHVPKHHVYWIKR